MRPAHPTELKDGPPALQVLPLRAKEAGAAAFPVWVAWNPMVVEAPGARVPL